MSFKMKMAVTACSLFLAGQTLQADTPLVDAKAQQDVNAGSDVNAKMVTAAPDKAVSDDSDGSQQKTKPKKSSDDDDSGDDDSESDGS